MPIGSDTSVTARHLPHLEKRGKTYFVTFTTIGRRVLPPKARDIALSCCLHDHQVTYWMDVAVVMPDHVHLVLTPYEPWTLSLILRRTKGVSSRKINELLGRRGALWYEESFDRIVRRGEDVHKKCAYVVDNPVRAGIIEDVNDYRWIWREWVEGRA